jgi:hypothetical protein
MLNAAIIGLGWWGKELVRSVQDRSEFIRFSRAVTLQPGPAQEFAAETGLVLGTSYEDVLADPKIDAVVLATPHTLHAARLTPRPQGENTFSAKSPSRFRSPTLAPRSPLVVKQALHLALVTIEDCGRRFAACAR